MMVDLGSFGEEKFNAKVWVNAACKARHPDDPAEKYLGDLEMKLQLMAENIAASLEEQSSQALLRVPRASRDVLRVRDDAVSLRSTVSAVLNKLKQAEGTSAESVAALARVDAVKQRMEAAHETLQDAAGLAKLSASVEDVFASGDLPRVAETLAQMRRCLAVVGEVPEFANVKRQLEGLEDRLEGMVQPRLADALTQRKVESTQGLRDILITIGRYNSLEQHYTRVRMRPLKRLWEEYEAAKAGIPLAKLAATDNSAGGDRRPATMSTSVNGLTTSFADWLPHFYDEVLLVLEQELKWCMVAFPEDYKLLVPRLLIETMGAISASFVTRIDTSTDEAASISRASVGGGETGEGRGRNSCLGLLIGLHSVTGSFARNVQHLLSAVDLAELARVLQAIYQPFEGYKQRYGELERGQLLGEIAALDLRGAVQRGIGQRGVELSETVRRMEASIPEITVALEAAVDRCISFTGGVEAEVLLRTLDEVVLHYLAILLEILKSLRTICGVDRLLEFIGSSDLSNLKKDVGLLDGAVKKEAGSSLPMDVVPEEEEWSIVQGALQLLTVAEGLSSRSAVFEASLRAALSRLGSRLELSNVLDTISRPGALPFTASENEDSSEVGIGLPLGLDISILRLIGTPDKTKRLASLLEQAKDPRFHALPHTSQRVGAFTEAVNELVYEVLMSKVRTKLTDVARLPVWNQEEEENLFELPSFSAYPLPYVMSIGEYLLTLPQQLLPVAGDGGPTDGVEEGSDEAQYSATEWMFKVAEGATALYIDQIRGIQVLSERGSQQLSADIEYLCNVLSALSMSTPLVLSTFQVCVSTPRSKLPELAEQDGGTPIDNPTFRLVCKMRQVSLE